MARPDVIGAPSGARTDHSFASRSVPAHLVRGIAGFIPLIGAWYLWPRVGWVALVPAAVGVVALRGCPTCWTIGLVQTVSRRRFQQQCDDAGCRLVLAPHRNPGDGRRAAGPGARGGPASDRPIPREVGTVRR